MIPTDSTESYSAPPKDLRRLYGHGQCASLALAVLQHLKLPCVVFFGREEDGDDGAHHVANKFGDRYLDVYGIVTQAEMESRYGVPLNMVPDPDGSNSRIQFEVCMSEYGDDDIDPWGTDLAWRDCSELMLAIIVEHELLIGSKPVKRRLARP